MSNTLILNGLYKHYKGDLYYVCNMARNTETGKSMVIYYACNRANEPLYVRPASTWFDQVGVDDAGQPITRFTRCE